jgi:hypothetical protein
VLLTPAKHVTGVVDTGDVMHHRGHWYRAVNIANFAGVIDTGKAYYFSIASIQSSKESSNYNKIVCLAGVNDTGDAPEKSNISASIKKNRNRY